ncbi:MAG: prepilin peptidase [Deltaproteobacteria bacterium]|nr:prepilin peptidase [Deltaproteobacteria bacterium]
MTKGLLVVLLVTAALWDIRRRRIPNALSAAVFLAGLVGAVLSAGWLSALSGLAASVLTVAIFWIPWRKGMVGGGDVKLAGAAAACVGLSLLHEYLLAIALAGALVALVCFLLSKRSARQEMVTNLKMVTVGVLPRPPLRGGGGRVSVPYGVACAAAALLIAFVRKGW